MVQRNIGKITMCNQVIQRKHMPAEYVPYGVEWKRELMKWRKGDLIGLLRQALTKKEKVVPTNSAMVPCVWHAYGQPCDVGFGCFCDSKPCLLAQHQ